MTIGPPVRNAQVDAGSVPVDGRAGRIQIGNAPCSWGTLEFGSTKADRFTYDLMLDQLVESGYTGCELGDWGFMPTDPDELYAAFSSRNLTITGAYLGIRFRLTSAHDAGETEALKIARQLARLSDRLGASIQPIVVLADDNATVPIRTENAGRATDEMTLSDDEWTIFAEGVNRVARAVQSETGLQCGIHHHCAGFVERPNEIERLLALTDSEAVGLVFDTGHYAFGAGSCDGVMNAMVQFADRICYVHFKDCHPKVMAEASKNQWDYFEAVEHGVFCELGEGCVDFDAIATWLREQGYSGYITVEQDILPGMGRPLDSARRNREYLRSLGL